MKSVVILCAVFALLSGCVAGPDRAPNIRGKGIESQVYACAAGFGDEIATKLNAQYQEDVKKGDMGVEASRKTAATLITLLPENQRLDGYKEYVKCLQLDIKVPSKAAPLSTAEAMKLSVDMCSGKDIDISQFNTVRPQSIDDIKRVLGDDFSEKSFNKYRDCISDMFDKLMPNIYQAPGGQE